MSVTKTVEASFPSLLERSVASALLLLAASPPKRKRNNSTGNPDRYERSRVSKEESPRAHQLTVVTFVPRFREVKLTIVRKKRSKSIWISNGKKMKSSNPESNSAPTSSENASEITTVEGSSCLSTGSSVQSCRYETSEADRLKNRVLSGHMGHRAAQILRILANGSASEVKIRQLLGDSPSTSKALRLLLRQEEVKRYGAGGRADPYIYMIAP